MSRTYVIGCLVFSASVVLGIAYPPFKFPPVTTSTQPAASAEFLKPTIPVSQTTPLLATSASTSGQAVSAPPAANPSGAAKGISAVWVNEGGDKVTRDELRTVTKHRPVQSSIWDGTTIRMFGAKNEVVT